MTSACGPAEAARRARSGPARPGPSRLTTSYGGRSMTPLDEAIAHVLAGCRPLPPASTPAAGARGRVLAADVVAAEPVPSFANTAMDGYAVRAADVAVVPVTLPVVAEVAAGHPAPRPLAGGEAMRIFTGAPVPEGADAVVMVERTERRDGGKAVEIQVSVDV